MAGWFADGFCFIQLFTPGRFDIRDGVLKCPLESCSPYFESTVIRLFETSN